jgi:hypothetical protein
MYTDANGVQRTEIVVGHNETAKYVFETDASVIASSSGAGWAIDVRGRPGWYYDAIAVSTLKWYAGNGISTPPSLEFNKMQSVYMIATMDATTLLPRMRVITSASEWDYTLPAAANIINGESYLFYFGNKAITLNPSVHPLLMTRTLISGPGANNEVISEINVVTATSGTNGSRFLLQAAGIWNQDLLQRFETLFQNVRAFTAESNLISLGFTGPSLLTHITNYPTTQQVSVTGTVAVADNTGNIILTAINNRQVVSPNGGRGNFINSATIAGWADSASFDGGFQYGIDSVFCYEDTASTATGDIAIIGSTNNSTFQLIGLVTPVERYDASGVLIGRWATTRLNVAPFRYLRLRNVDGGSLGGVVASIFAGKQSGAV